jgi:prepilin-type processing-associated H-X9-DG protein
MSSVYATDDAQGSLPSFTISQAGGNPTDVATTFIVNLVPYGMTMPMYFCPARPGDVDVANDQFKNGHGSLPAQHRFMNTITDLNKWVVQARSNNGGYAKLIHLWWVPRETSLGGYGPPQPDGGSLFPWPNWGGNKSAPADALPWPLKTSDTSISQQPIISDYTEVSGDMSTSPNDLSGIKPAAAGSLGYAHFYNGSLQSINVGFADGHVDTHNRSAITWQYTGNGGSQSYFY